MMYKCGAGGLFLFLSPGKKEPAALIYAQIFRNILTEEGGS
jgi:hypothetical protein